MEGGQSLEISETYLFQLYCVGQLPWCELDAIS